MACHIEIKTNFKFIDQLVPCFGQSSFKKKRVELGHLTVRLLQGKCDKLSELLLISGALVKLPTTTTSCYP